MWVDVTVHGGGLRCPALLSKWVIMIVFQSLDTLYNSCLVFIKRCVWVVVMNIWIIFILECGGLGGVANIN